MQITIENPYAYAKRISKKYILPKGKTHTISGDKYVTTKYVCGYATDNPQNKVFGLTIQEVIMQLTALYN